MKRILLSILSLITFSLAVSAQTTGQCGDDATYVLSEDSTLTISGKGALWERAFKERADIKKANINEGITNVSAYAFESCYYMESVSLPASVKNIGEAAFIGCPYFTEISLSEGLESIEDKAFQFSMLTSIDIPASVKSIGSEVFDGSMVLKNINVAEGNATYSSVDGVLFSKDGTELLICPSGKEGEYSVSAGVKKIAADAFEGCNKFTTITLPASLESVAASSFSLCYSLNAIVVDADNSNYASADGVLYNKNMTELILCPFGKSGEFVVPDGVTTIGSIAFEICDKITKLTLPAGLTTIGNTLFKFGGESLETIVSRNPEPPVCGTDAWSRLDVTKVKVYVPAKSLELYQAAEEWKKFTLGSIETAVEENAEADGLVVTASNGTIKCNAESFTILNLIGQDVTAENGSLQGVYIVRARESVVKVSVK